MHSRPRKLNSRSFCQQTPSFVHIHNAIVPSLEYIASLYTAIPSIGGGNCAAYAVCIAGCFCMYPNEERGITRWGCCGGRTGGICKPRIAVIGLGSCALARTTVELFDTTARCNWSSPSPLRALLQSQSKSHTQRHNACCTNIHHSARLGTYAASSFLCCSSLERETTSRRTDIRCS